MRQSPVSTLSILAFALLMEPSGATAESPGVDRRPRPAWVEPIDWDRNSLNGRDAAGDGGQRFLLYERQVNVAEVTEYTHHAIQFLTESAVQEGSRISVSFDPGYNSIAFHRLTIYRDGEAMDRLPGQEIKLLQREERLDRHLFDGRTSAVVVIEDVRVGDVLEYAFSISGANPIFEGRYVDSFSTQWSESLERVRFRLLWPSDRRLFTKQHGSEMPPPAVLEHENTTEYVWDFTHSESVISDGDVPSWYDPWEWVQLTEFESWEAVAQWGHEIYNITESLPEDLKGEMDRIRGLPDDEARILAALRYVQDEIRYLGIEVGPNSHKPYPIKTILSRRFGDCKDKSLLLCTMLRELGLDARPALVDTVEQGSISDWLPSPLAFNHVVVFLRLEDREFWFDPTNSYQGGPLDQLYFPDYRKALVIAPDTRALSDVRPGGFQENSLEMTEFFDFQDFEGEATMRVRTVYRGNEADSMRGHIADTSREEIGKSYLNYYARCYPQVRAIDPPRFRDSVERNVITVEESYHLTGLWEKSEGEDHRIQMEFVAQGIRDAIEKPSTRVRTMPFEISHPSRVKQVIEIDFPWTLEFDSENTTVTDDSFLATYSAESSGPKLTLRYTYESLKDHVLPEGVSTYIANIEKMQGLLSYEITVPGKWAGEVPSVEVAEKESVPTGPASSEVWGALPWIALIGGSLLFLLVLVVAAIVFFVWKHHARQVPNGAVISGAAPLSPREPPPLPIQVRRCAVCGRTDATDPGLHFSAAGGRTFCPHHLPEST